MRTKFYSLSVSGEEVCQFTMNNLCNDAFYGNPARRPRQYRLRECPLMDVYTDGEMHDRFRRDSINFITNLVYNDLVRSTRRNRALTVDTQVLIALRYFACCSFSTGDRRRNWSL